MEIDSSLDVLPPAGSLHADPLDGVCEGAT